MEELNDEREEELYKQQKMKDELYDQLQQHKVQHEQRLRSSSTAEDHDGDEGTMCKHMLSKVSGLSNLWWNLQFRKYW